MSIEKKIPKTLRTGYRLLADSLVAEHLLSHPCVETFHKTILH